MRDSKDNSGKAPLFFATWKGHQHVVELLLAREDVFPHLKASEGFISLSMAAKYGHDGIVSLLSARK